MNSSAWTALAQRVRDTLSQPAPKKKTCACAANYGLVLFLRGVAEEALSNGNDTWSMTLRRAAKGIAAAEVAVTSEAQAVRDVNGVGKTTSALLSTFWAVRHHFRVVARRPLSTRARRFALLSAKAATAPQLAAALAQAAALRLPQRPANERRRRPRSPSCGSRSTRPPTSRCW
jgi:hypothetical protein